MTTQSIDTPNPLMQLITLDGQKYLTSQREHAEYVRNATERGEKIKYERHTHFCRVIRDIPNFNILIDQKDIIDLTWNDFKASNSVVNQILVCCFKKTSYRPLLLLNPIAQMELTHHLDDELHQETAYRHSQQGATINLAEVFLRQHGFLTYKTLYELPLIQEICRVWGVKIPTGDKHWPGVGMVFQKFIYGMFPEEIQGLLQRDKRRGKYIHMEFRDDRRYDTLKQRETQIVSLLRLCDDGDKDTFISLLERHDRRIGLDVQVAMRIRVHLSTVATGQLLLFDREGAA